MEHRWWLDYTLKISEAQLSKTNDVVTAVNVSFKLWSLKYDIHANSFVEKC